MRGSLTSMAMFNLSFGILLGFVIATYFNYYIIPGIALVFPAIYLIAVIYFPETPHFLLRKRKISQARDSYNFYHNIPSAPAPSAEPNLQNNTPRQMESGTASKKTELTGFDELMTNILNSEGVSSKLTRSDFCKLVFISFIRILI